jgi:hypothetical protein
MMKLLKSLTNSSLSFRENQRKSERERERERDFYIRISEMANCD